MMVRCVRIVMLLLPVLIKVFPLIISTGCTLHNEFRKALKSIIPDGLLRSGVLTDISVYMARGRAQLYCNVLEGI